MNPNRPRDGEIERLHARATADNDETLRMIADWKAKHGQEAAWRRFRWLPPIMTAVWILALVAWIVAGQMPRVGLALALVGAGVWAVGSGMVVVEVIRRRRKT